MPSTHPSLPSIEQNENPASLVDPNGVSESPQKPKKSKLGALKKLFKSPAVESYEKNVSKDKKDWGTGNEFGGGPYRPLAMTPGAAEYYTAKGAASE